ncbi:MAG: MazG nucleotide pyrophosphohydrolase domain-containing protein [Bacteriovoracia bacterium]
MLNLPENPTLNQFQEYVVELEKERGFDKQDILIKCLLLVEEIGELYKAIRKQAKIAIDPSSKVSDVEQEIADAFIMLLSVANRLDINLEKAFLDKEEINKKRVWK